jgi:uncharacterized protein (DUF169 family)
MAEQAQRVAEEIATYLGMKSRPVGVKILAPGDEDSADAPIEKKTFCQFVAAAAKGEQFLVRMDDLNCLNAEVALGFREPKYVNIEPRIKTKTGAVRVGPLEDADVVLFILNPEQVMTLSIILEGLSAEFKGNMAVCGEAVAKVYSEGKANVTFLCNGARLYGEYEPSQLILSLPYAQFMELLSKMGKFDSLSKKARDGFARLLLRIK